MFSTLISSILLAWMVMINCLEERIEKIDGYVGHYFEYDFLDTIHECRISAIRIDDDRTTTIPSWISINSFTWQGFPDVQGHSKIFLLIIGNNLGYYSKLCLSLVLELNIFQSHSIQYMLSQLNNQSLGKLDSSSDECHKASKVYIFSTIFSHNTRSSPLEILDKSNNLSNIFNISVKSIQAVQNTSPLVLFKQLRSLEILAVNVFEKYLKNALVFSWFISCSNYKSHLNNLYNKDFLKKIEILMQNKLSWQMSAGYLLQSQKRQKREVVERFFGSILAYVGTPVETSSIEEFASWESWTSYAISTSILLDHTSNSLNAPLQSSKHQSSFNGVYSLYPSLEDLTFSSLQSTFSNLSLAMNNITSDVFSLYGATYSHTHQVPLTTSNFVLKNSTALKTQNSSIFHMKNQSITESPTIILPHSLTNQLYLTIKTIYSIQVESISPSTIDLLHSSSSNHAFSHSYSLSFSQIFTSQTHDTDTQNVAKQTFFSVIAIASTTRLLSDNSVIYSSETQASIFLGKTTPSVQETVSSTSQLSRTSKIHSVHTSDIPYPSENYFSKPYSMIHSLGFIQSLNLSESPSYTFTDKSLLSIGSSYHQSLHSTSSLLIFSTTVDEKSIQKSELFVTQSKNLSESYFKDEISYVLDTEDVSYSQPSLSNYSSMFSSIDSLFVSKISYNNDLATFFSTLIFPTRYSNISLHLSSNDLISVSETSYTHVVEPTHSLTILPKLTSGKPVILSNNHSHHSSTHFSTSLLSLSKLTYTDITKTTHSLLVSSTMTYGIPLIPSKKHFNPSFLHSLNPDISSIQVFETIYSSLILPTRYDIPVISSESHLNPSFLHSLNPKLSFIQVFETIYSLILHTRSCDIPVMSSESHLNPSFLHSLNTKISFIQVFDTFFTNSTRSYGIPVHLSKSLENHSLTHFLNDSLSVPKISYTHVVKPMQSSLILPTRSYDVPSVPIRNSHLNLKTSFFLNTQTMWSAIYSVSTEHLHYSFKSRVSHDYSFPFLSLSLGNIDNHFFTGISLAFSTPIIDIEFNKYSSSRLNPLVTSSIYRISYSGIISAYTNSIISYVNNSIYFSSFDDVTTQIDLLTPLESLSMSHHEYITSYVPITIPSSITFERQDTSYLFNWTKFPFSTKYYIDFSATYGPNFKTTDVQDLSSLILTSVTLNFNSSTTSYLSDNLKSSSLFLINSTINSVSTVPFQSQSLLVNYSCTDITSLRDSSNFIKPSHLTMTLMTTSHIFSKTNNSKNNAMSTLTDFILNRNSITTDILSIASTMKDVFLKTSFIYQETTLQFSSVNQKKRSSFSNYLDIKRSSFHKSTVYSTNAVHELNTATFDTHIKHSSLKERNQSIYMNNEIIKTSVSISIILFTSPSTSILEFTGITLLSLQNTVVKGKYQTIDSLTTAPLHLVKSVNSDNSLMTSNISPTSIFVLTPKSSTTSSILYVKKPIDYLVAHVGRLFSHIIKNETFYNLRGGKLQFECYLSNEQDLRSNGWLIFNPASPELYGIPLISHFNLQPQKGFIIYLTAHDSDGNNATDIFQIIVWNTEVTISFVVHLNISYDYKHFMANKKARYDLSKHIIDFYDDSKISSFFLVSIKEGSTIFSWSITSLHLKNDSIYNKFLGSIQDGNKPKSLFVDYLLPGYILTGIDVIKRNMTVTNNVKPLPSSSGSNNKSSLITPLIILSISLLAALVAVFILCYLRVKKKRREYVIKKRPQLLPDELELKQMSLTNEPLYVNEMPSSFIGPCTLDDEYDDELNKIPSSSSDKDSSSDEEQLVDITCELPSGMPPPYRMPPPYSSVKHNYTTYI